MLFKLDDSLIKPISRDTPDPQLIMTLNNLAKCRQEGTHLVFGSRKLIQAVLSCIAIDNLTKSVFNKIKNKLTMLGSLSKTLDRRVDIVDIVKSPNVSTRDTQKVLEIPYDKFRDIWVFSPTTILGENMVDAEIYLSIARIFKVTNPILKGVHLKCDLDMGGGSTTYRKYEYLQKKPKLCLCILDNDKKSPDSQMGATAHEVSKVDKVEIPFAEFYVIRARDVENLIPSKFLFDLYSSTKALDLFQDLSKCSFPEAIYHFDMKDGLNLKILLDLPLEDKVRGYWLKILQEIRADCKCVIEENSCNKSTCFCSQFNGFGSKLANNFHEKILKQTSNQKLSESVFSCGSDPVLKSMWEEIGRLVISWCCGSAEKMSAI